MAKYLRLPQKHAMKKIIALSLTVFLLFSMTSCAAISSFSNFIENTVPNVIATQIKNDIIPSDKGNTPTQTTKINDEPTPNTTQNNSNDQTTFQPEYAPLPNENDINYANLINNITTDTIKACVNIRTLQSNTNTPERSSIGSGVIFKADKEKTSGGLYVYYVLTNYHVVELDTAYQYYKYTITDYQGNEYKAITPSWLNDNDMKKLCKENDLSILEFETDKELKVIELQTKNPAINSTLISIGQPKGQQNAITIGTVEDYTSVSIQNTLTPSFDVIAHNSPIDRGNSGGAIINTDLELVGINFAGSWNDDGSFAYGYGIPIETVRKFLSDYGISL